MLGPLSSQLLGRFVLQKIEDSGRGFERGHSDDQISWDGEQNLSDGGLSISPRRGINEVE